MNNWNGISIMFGSAFVGIGAILISNFTAGGLFMLGGRGALDGGSSGHAYGG